MPSSRNSYQGEDRGGIAQPLLGQSNGYANHLDSPRNNNSRSTSSDGVVRKVTEYLGDDEDIARRGGIGEEEEEDDLVIHHGREMTGGKLSERERLARGFELDNLGDDDERDGFKDEEDVNRHHASSPLLFHGYASLPPTSDLPPLAQPTSTKSNLSSAIANMANSILGAGIIGLPFAISEAGFFTGLFLLVVLCGVTDWTIRLIVVDAKMCGRGSYIGIMEFCFGWWGRVAVSFFQFAFALGGMCACGVIIGDTIPSVIRYIFPSLTDPSTHPFLSIFANRRFVILVATVGVSWPLSLYKDIAKLSRASGMALISMFVIVASVTLRGPFVDDSLRGPTEGIFSVIEPKVFEAIGVMSFAFVCHHNSLLIYGSLQTPTLDRFNAVTHASTFMSLICCVLMSLAGYLSFRSKTQGNILNNFPNDDLIINIARLCFGLNMFTTSPLEAFVCREVIEELFFEGEPFSWRRHIGVTTILVFATMLVAMTTCDLGIVLEITGGLSATALAYLFPAMAYFKLTKGPWYSRQKLPALLCTAFGVIVMFLSLLLAIRKLVTGGAHSDKVCQ